MRFWVNVPVLSLQMQVTAPKVSMMSRLLTSTPKVSIFCAVRVSATVS